MSTWKNVGMTYLKYADLCATHVRNALKEPAKAKALSRSDMRARVMVWTEGKRGPAGTRRPPKRHGRRQKNGRGGCTDAWLLANGHLWCTLGTDGANRAAVAMHASRAAACALRPLPPQLAALAALSADGLT